MKIYRIQWLDENGIAQAWADTEEAAKKIMRSTLKAAPLTRMDFSISAMEFPEDKAEIIQWLNIYCNAVYLE